MPDIVLLVLSDPQLFVIARATIVASTEDEHIMNISLESAHWGRDSVPIIIITAQVVNPITPSMLSASATLFIISDLIQKGAVS